MFRNAAHENAAAHEALIEEGRKARKNGKESYDNPYSYRFELLAANAWDDGWKGAGQ